MSTFGRSGVQNFLNRKDQEPEETGVVEDDVRKQSTYFINTLHNNTGYFLTVSKRHKKSQNGYVIPTIEL